MISLQAIIKRIKTVSSDARLVTSKPKIGRMCAFMYNPKTKDKLPYYDVFPLVIPVDYTATGFYGINFHYLDVSNRIRLLNTIAPFETLNNSNTKSIRISYLKLKALSSTAWKPCFKQYLFRHIRSKIIDIPKSDWNEIIKLPISGFVKSSSGAVHKDSKRISGK